jgi:hypothetical protein
LNGNSACLQNRRYFFKTEVKAAYIINVYIWLPFSSLFLLLILWMEDKTLNTWLPPVHVRALFRKGEVAPSGQALLYGSFLYLKE